MPAEEDGRMIAEWNPRLCRLHSTNLLDGRLDGGDRIAGQRADDLTRPRRMTVDRSCGALRCPPCVARAGTQASRVLCTSYPRRGSPVSACLQLQTRFPLLHALRRFGKSRCSENHRSLLPPRSPRTSEASARWQVLCDGRPPRHSSGASSGALFSARYMTAPKWRTFKPYILPDAGGRNTSRQPGASSAWLASQHHHQRYNRCRSRFA